MNEAIQNSVELSPHLSSLNSTQSCMDVCTQCHQTLMHAAMQYSLISGGVHLEPRHFRLMINCAEICQTTANFHLSDSEFCRNLALMTAEICELCASSCKKIGDLEECVQACLQCAQGCREMNRMNA